jgi:hypothetical protein
LASACLGAVGVGGDVGEIDTPAGPGSLAPSLAELNDGRLVLTWLEETDGGHALRFSVLGEAGFGPARTIARGEDWFANWADTPGLFVLPGGDWIAHWLVKSGPATYAYDILTARSTDGGASWSDPVSPHRDLTATEHGFVSYFAESPDAAGLVWLDGRAMAGAAADEAAMSLRSAILGPDGRLSERVVLDDRVCECCRTAAAMASGGPVVVYRDRSGDEIRDHAVVRRGPGGWQRSRPVHVDGWQIRGCPVNGPALVADGRRLATAWFTMAEQRPRVHVAVSENAGKSFRVVDTLGVGTALGRVDLALIDGGFMLSWLDESDGSGLVRLAAYDWQGTATGGSVVTGLDTGRSSGFPRLGVVDGCRPVVAWTGSENGDRRVRVARGDPATGCAGAVDRSVANP